MGAVFRLTGNTVMPAPGVRVLRAADYARLVEANDVLAAARERAAAMAAEAEKAYEERRQAGYEDGLMEGRMEQAEKMMETAMQAVEYIEGVEAKLVGVVTSAVRKIIGELDDRTAADLFIFPRCFVNECSWSFRTVTALLKPLGNLGCHSCAQEYHH